MEKMIFVFGSNESGIHGKGAAKTARESYGAKMGQGFGLQGESFALPTKDYDIMTLPLPAVKKYVNDFLEIAEKTPEHKYQVTRIGCGLAGFTDEDIYPLFKQRPSNVLLPGYWLYKLGELKTPRIIIAGSRSLIDQEKTIMDLISHDLYKFGKNLEIVSGLANGPDLFGFNYGKNNGIKTVQFPVLKEEWDQFGKKAGMLRNMQMGWYATHLLAFHDGSSPGTTQMIKFAQENKLLVNTHMMSSLNLKHSI
jgi:hypothetical protein